MIHKIYSARAKITACGKQVLEHDLDRPNHLMEVATPLAFDAAYNLVAEYGDAVGVNVCENCYDHKPSLAV